MTKQVAVSEEVLWNGTSGEVGELVVNPDQSFPNPGRVGVLVEIKDGSPNPYVIEYDTGNQWSYPYAAKITDDFFVDYYLSRRPEFSKRVREIRQGGDGRIQFFRPYWYDFGPIKDDLLALLEVARIALEDSEFSWYTVGESMDISNDEVDRLQGVVERFLQADPPAGSTGSPLARAVALVGKDYNPHMEDKQVERILKSYGHLLDRSEIKRMVATHAYTIGQQFAYDNGEVDFHAAGLEAEQAVMGPG